MSAETATAYPPAGAGPLRVIVPVVDVPPDTLVGAIEKSVGTGALTVTFPVCEIPLAVPVTVTVVFV